MRLVDTPSPNLILHSPIILTQTLAQHFCQVGDVSFNSQHRVSTHACFTRASVVFTHARRRMHPLTQGRPLHRSLPPTRQLRQTHPHKVQKTSLAPPRGLRPRPSSPGSPICVITREPDLRHHPGARSAGTEPSALEGVGWVNEAPPTVLSKSLHALKTYPIADAE